MMNIYEALKSGQTPDAIAQAFVNELNAAIQQQEADRIAADQAAKKEAEKQDLAKDLALRMNAFLGLYYPEAPEFAPENIIDMCEANLLAGKMTQKIKDNDFDGAIDDFNKAIDKFFKENNI